MRCSVGVLRVLSGVVLLSTALPLPAPATVIVPDQFPTIQSAIDSDYQVILVRPGWYPEWPRIDRPLAVRALLSPGDSLPAIAGLILDDTRQDSVWEATVELREFHIRGPVENTFHLGLNTGVVTLAFESCVLDSGVTDDLASLDTQHGWWFQGCTIQGTIRLIHPEFVSLIESSLSGMADLGPSDDVSVGGSQLLGSGAGVALTIRPNCESFTVDATTIRGYDTGILANPWHDGRIRNNLIEQCPGFGIQVGEGDFIEISGNTIRSCGSSIALTGIERGSMSGNIVEDCTWGPAAQIGLEAHVTGNQVRRSGAGIRVGAERVIASDNRVQSCSFGTTLHGESVTCARDTILDCGGGMWLGALSWSDIIVDRCRVISSGTTGIRAIGRNLSVTGNVVGRSGGAGLLLELQEEGTTLVRSNTCYSNTGSGLVLSGIPPASGTVDRNISHRNQGFGLELDTAGPVTLGCNDWFENTLGDVKGGSPAASDLAVDPQFCGVAGDEVQLFDSSPLVNASGCGLVGALGPGCVDSTTATLVPLFEASWTEGGIGIRWQLEGSRMNEVWLERASLEAADWVRIGSDPGTGAFVTLLDREVTAGAAYRYRLMGHDGLTTVLLAGPIAVDVRGPATLRLIGVSPNPAREAARVEFALAHRAEIELALFDLQGRGVATLARGVWPSGTHAISVRALEPGVYFIRYRHPRGENLARLVLSR